MQSREASRAVPDNSKKSFAYFVPDAPGDTVSPLVLLPAVDVAGGQAVRLVQGAAGTETSYGDPLAAARDWQQAGAEWIHLVDLDAAFRRGSNSKLLASIAAQVGGGVGG